MTAPSIETVAAARYLWQHQWSRPTQLPPEGEWDTWFVQAGRGFGKTRLGAEWLAQQAIWNPKTRWAVVAPTFSDARDTCVEGESGLKSVLDRYQMVKKWNRSLGEIDLLNGSKVKLFSADEPERLRGPQHHGAWCVAQGMPVKTLSAQDFTLIENVRPGDQVMTRQGYKTVLAATRTKVNAPVMQIVTGNGSRLECTGDHPVWVEGKGWTRADMIAIGDILVSCSLTKDPRLGSNGTTNAGTTQSAWADTATPAASCSPTPSGPTTTDQSPTGTKSTTSTTTRPTTTSTTSPASQPESTPENTPPRTAAEPEATPRPSTSSGPSDSPWSTSASTAETPSSARPHTPPTATRTIKRLTAVVGIDSNWACKDVYDLTVEDAHEFFAGDILVHNCDEPASWRYDDTWDQLRFGMRLGEHPRTVITGTPKPNKLTKRIVALPGVVVTRGSTFDNAANLSPAALEELRLRYEGTRLGRQELHGELLEDVEGALWTLRDIDQSRVPAAPDLERIVTAVDPAVTYGPDSDETGIITVGLASNGHYYVLNDATLKDTPDAWARAAVREYQRAQANDLVAEVNQGGELIKRILLSVDPNIRVKTVHAARGKHTRAEPVAALYEQGKVHHVGVLADLEDQMTTWVPGDDSPDRMDALVWAVTALMTRPVAPVQSFAT